MTTPTSPLPTASGGACIGAGVGPTLIDRAIGGYKLNYPRYEGPFPTELEGSLNDHLCDRGGEFGTNAAAAAAAGSTVRAATLSA